MDDLISRQAAIDALDTGLWGVEWDKALAAAMLKDLPSAQPKITADYVIEWLHKRGLDVIDGALYAEMKRKCGGCVYEPIERVW